MVAIINLRTYLARIQSLEKHTATKLPELCPSAVLISCMRVVSLVWMRNRKFYSSQSCVMVTDHAQVPRLLTLHFNPCPLEPYLGITIACSMGCNDFIQNCKTKLQEEIVYIIDR